MYNKKVKNAKEWEYDDRKFKSGLELFCYKQLNENNIPFIYQPGKTVLLNSFDINYKCYESIGKIYRDKDKKIINNTKRFDLVDSVREISYTPDFICPDMSWIIETKGFANDSFPLRWKMFEAWLFDHKYDGVLMKPENQKEVLQCIEIINKFKDNDS